MTGAEIFSILKEAIAQQQIQRITGRSWQQEQMNRSVTIQGNTVIEGAVFVNLELHVNSSTSGEIISSFAGLLLPRACRNLSYTVISKVLAVDLLDTDKFQNHFILAAAGLNSQLLRNYDLKDIDGNFDIKRIAAGL